MSTATKPYAVYLQDRVAAEEGMCNGWIREVYEHAVAYTTFSKNVRGVTFLFGGIGTAVLAVFVGWLSLDLLRLISGSAAPWWLFVLLAVGLAIFLSIALFALTHYGRLEFFRPLDLPIIFDRMRRKVYRLDQTPPPGWFGAFKPWPIQYKEHDWDDIVAEHAVVTYTTGSSAQRQHTLALMVRNKDAGLFSGEITPDNRPPYADGFLLGDPKTLSELSTPRVWEHVRRYMNDNGPPLPPGESVCDTTPPVTWWESLGAVSMFGPGYVQRWRESWGWMLVIHLLAPLMLPLALLMATTNWLSYKTAYAVPWPQEVLNRVGPPMQMPR